MSNLTRFEKIAGGLFVAARAGNGAGLLILPFLLVPMAVVWMVWVLGSALFKGIAVLVAKATSPHSA